MSRWRTAWIHFWCLHNFATEYEDNACRLDVCKHCGKERMYGR